MAVDQCYMSDLRVWVRIIKHEVCWVRLEESKNHKSVSGPVYLVKHQTVSDIIDIIAGFLWSNSDWIYEKRECVR